MGRYNRHRRDGNSKEIIAHLRAHGVTVEDTSQQGGGFPDLVCLFRSKVTLLEVKNKAGAGLSLTPAEKAFHAVWDSVTVKVSTKEEAVIAVGVSFKKLRTKVS